MALEVTCPQCNGPILAVGYLQGTLEADCPLCGCDLKIAFTTVQDDDYYSGYEVIYTGEEGIGGYLQDFEDDEE